MKKKEEKKPTKDVTGKKVSEESLKDVAGGRMRAEECPTGNASALKAV